MTEVKKNTADAPDEALLDQQGKGKLKPQDAETSADANPNEAPKEVGGPNGPEPTRYGDWAYHGRVTDF